MTPAAKSITRDVEETRRHLDTARVSVKKACVRSDELLKIDMDLLAHSRGQIADACDRFKQKQRNALQRSPYFRPIDRKVLGRHLQQAERHVAVGQGHISRQRDCVAQLERDGHDAVEARGLLAQFEELQSMHIAHRTASRASLATGLEGSTARLARLCFRDLSLKRNGHYRPGFMVFRSTAG
jgi:hypothetical protein